MAFIWKENSKNFSSEGVLNDKSVHILQWCLDAFWLSKKKKRQLCPKCLPKSLDTSGPLYFWMPRHNIFFFLKARIVNDKSLDTQFRIITQYLDTFWLSNKRQTGTKKSLLRSWFDMFFLTKMSKYFWTTIFLNAKKTQYQTY